VPFRLAAPSRRCGALQWRRTYRDLHHVDSKLQTVSGMTRRDAYEADGTALEPSAPLVMLVNRGTASASEVGGATGRLPPHCQPC